MTPSPRIADFIKGYEKLRLKGYLPTPHDVPTIGYGATGPEIALDTVWAIQQADERFADDLAKFGGGVWALIGGAGGPISIPPRPTTQDQFDAMVSLSYNIGLANFRSSSVLTNHKAGHYSTAALAFGLWNKQRDSQGVLQVLDGLTTRRAAEAAIYSET